MNGSTLVLGATAALAVGVALRPNGSPARAKRWPHYVEVDSRLFRESGANITEDHKVDVYAQRMESGWGRFPPVSGQLTVVDRGDLETYEEAEAEGYAHELAWSRPLTRADVGRETVVIEDGHHRCYAAARNEIPIRVAPYDGVTGRAWTQAEVDAWWTEHERGQL